MSHPGAPGGALASNPLPRWEKLAMEASLWVCFYGNRTTREERRSPDLWERILALMIDAWCFASSVKRLSGALHMESYPKFHNEVGVAIVRIGCHEFKCIGDKPPQYDPHHPQYGRCQ